MASSKQQRLVDERLWELLEPLIPPQAPGRGRVGARGSTTAPPWRAFSAGVWDQLHRRVLEELSDAEVLDWSRASVDAVSVRAKRGAS